MFCPGVLSRRTAKTANGVGLSGQITSRCQTNMETFNIEVQHTGILPSKKSTRLCITQDRRCLAIGVSVKPATTLVFYSFSGNFPCLSDTFV